MNNSKRQRFSDEDDAEEGMLTLPGTTVKFEVAELMLGIPPSTDLVASFLRGVARECDLAGLAFVLECANLAGRGCTFMLSEEVPILDEHALISKGPEHIAKVFVLFASHPRGGLLFFETLVDHFCFDCPMLVDVFWDCTKHLWEAHGSPVLQQVAIALRHGC
jgi:hypothetical protein